MYHLHPASQEVYLSEAVLPSWKCLFSSSHQLREDLWATLKQAPLVLNSLYIHPGGLSVLVLGSDLKFGG